MCKEFERALRQELLAVKQLLQMFLHLAELREARQLVQEALKRREAKNTSNRTKTPWKQDRKDLKRLKN